MSTEETILNASILDDIKKMLGIQPDYEYFDQELIIFINSAFSKIHQLGVGPDRPYAITSSENTWNEFMKDKDYLVLIQSYVYTNVKLAFDPPTSSAAMDALKKIGEEYEWRLNVAEETDAINGTA